MKELLAYLDGKQVYVNVISKFGGTMDPALAFWVMRLYMEEGYDSKAVERIIVTTDVEKGILKDTDLCDEWGEPFRCLIPVREGLRVCVFSEVEIVEEQSV